jgi:uncharacterized protein DUF3987
VTRKLPNWIQGYLTYTAESESPEEYHLWVAISAIAGAMRRQSFFNYEYFIVYPNMYVILVGPAGRCKKSTAMRIGRGMLSGVEGIKFTTDSVTRERLIQDLSQAKNADGHSSMTAYSSEFATLLTSSGMDMVVFLTDIYDSPMLWEHSSKTGGTNKIVAPYLNLIGGTTPDWIAKAMPLDTVGIGLTSRIVFVYQDTPRIKPPFPKLNASQKALHPMLIEDLAKISTIRGEYLWESVEAEKEYEKWYEGRLANPNPSGDPRLNGYFERKPVHLIKLMMILAASKNDNLKLTFDDFHAALALFEQVEVKMPKVFANVGKNPLAVDYDDVAMAILMHPGVSFHELMWTFKHSVRKEELNEIIETLIAMEFVVALPNQKYQHVSQLKGA